jgi:hypothetical protein
MKNQQYSATAAAEMDCVITQVERPQLIELTVQAEFHTVGSDSVRKETVTVSAASDWTLQRVQDVFLRLLELRAETHKVAFTFEGKALHANQTLSSHQVVTGAVLTATVYSSEVVARRPAKKDNMGPPMRLTLRRKDAATGKVQEDCVTMGSKQPLQALVDKYRQEKNLGAGQNIVLMFDGEALDLKKLPAAYDMEDEDLIDVAIKG